MVTAERTATVQTIGRTISRPVLRAVRPGNLVPAVLWLIVLRHQLSFANFPPTLGSALLIFLTTWTIILFMVRRDPKTPATGWDMVRGLCGITFLALLPPAGPGDAFSNTVQVIGSSLAVAALLGLGRSFGVAPADRGLRQGGVYGLIRHPLYASEFIFFIGFFLTRPGFHAGIVIALWTAVQVIRMYREEEVIEGYAAYKSSVRWRILPYIW